MKKTILKTVLVIVMVLAMLTVTACGKAEEKKPEEVAGETTEEVVEEATEEAEAPEEAEKPDAEEPATEVATGKVGDAWDELEITVNGTFVPRDQECTNVLEQAGFIKETTSGYEVWKSGDVSIYFKGEKLLAFQVPEGIEAPEIELSGHFVLGKTTRGEITAVAGEPSDGYDGDINYIVYNTPAGDVTYSFKGAGESGVLYMVWIPIE